MKFTIDRIDFAILRALQNNGRLSNKELAAQVGLAPSSCLARVKRLTEDGILRGFHAEIEPRALGIGLQALISVRLSQHSRDLFESFRAHVLSLPETVAAYHLAGKDDFLVHVAVRDADHLRDVALDAFTRRREVARLETSLVFEHVRAGSLPMLERQESPKASSRGKSAKSAKVRQGNSK